MEPTTHNVVRFGVFEADLHKRELRKRGVRVRLQEQPFRVLEALLEKPGEIVTREQLKDRLWAQDEFVEFDKSLNTAVQKIRAALGDSADNPRFVETVPRRGYRFLSSVEPRLPIGDPAVEQRQSLSPAVFVPAGLLAIFALGAVWHWVGAPRRDAGAEPASPPVPLTSYPGQERAPDFSPDGKRVVFSWTGEAGDSADIYIKLIGGSTWQRLSSDPADDTSPAWSPDGRTIAFIRCGADSAELILIPSIGGPERRIGAVEKSYCPEQRISWFPDNRHLALWDRPNQQAPWSIFRVSLDTGERTLLTRPPKSASGDRYPAVSPDGRTLAFSRSESAREQSVYLLHLTDALEPEGPARKLTGDEYAWDPAWSGDGAEIIYTEGFNEDSRLRSIPARGGVSSPIQEAGSGSYPVVSRSGRRLAFVQSSSFSNIWRASLPDGADKRPVIRSTRRDLTPQYSPDGERITFSSSRTGYREIWVCDRDGSNALQVTELRSPMSSAPHWSPDSSAIAFQSIVDNQREIYVVQANGSGLRRLTDHPTVDAQPTWSHDGSRIYFSSNRLGEPTVWEVAAEGGEPALIGEGTYAIESWDGRQVFLVRRDDRERRSVWALDKKSATEQKIIEQVDLQSLNTTLGPDGIYFLLPESDREGQWWLWRHGFDEESPERLFPVEGSLAVGLAVAPDGSEVLFCPHGERSSDLMLIEELLLR